MPATLGATVIVIAARPRIGAWPGSCNSTGFCPAPEKTTPEPAARCFTPIGQHGQRHLQRVGLFIGERLGGQDRVAGHMRTDPPVHIALALGGNADLLRLAADYLQAR